MSMADALDGFDPSQREVRLANLLVGDADPSTRRILYQLVGRPQTSDQLADTLEDDVDALAVERALHRLGEDDLVVQELPDDEAEPRWSITPDGARVLLTAQTIRPLQELARVFRARLSRTSREASGDAGDEAETEGLARLQTASQRIGGKRDVWHVLPTDDGGWRVKREGARRASGVHETKQAATQAAKELARKREGTVILHRTDGSFQEEIEPAS